MSRFLALLCLGLGLLLKLTLLPANATTSMVLPLKLDYPLIRSFFVQQAFTEPGETAVVIDEPALCQLLTLARPEIYPVAGALRLKAFVSLQTGIPVLNTCRIPVELQGLIDVRLDVAFDATGWKLIFQPRDLRLTTPDGRSPLLASQIPELFQERLFAYLDQVTVDLAPPLQGLREIVPTFFAAQEQAAVSRWLSSIRPGKIEVKPEYFAIALLMEVEPQERISTPPPDERPLSAAEMEGFIRGWETWDAFLVHQIEQLGRFGLEEHDRALILQTLLESRYQMVTALAADQITPGPDLVRRQFMLTWERFAPMFRKYLNRDAATAPFASLAYLSAGDALSALDRIGPSVGVEISRDGLIRMARLLASEEETVNLAYSYEVDPGLREIMGLGPPLMEPNHPLPSQDVDLDLPADEDGDVREQRFLSPSTWLWLLPRPAYAAEHPPADRQALKEWLVARGNFDSYLANIRALLQEESRQSVAMGKLPAERLDLFTKILQATAWQESCCRQFTVKSGKMTYLRSWNNTSVGLMQINERVWRGVYRLDALRWDPQYNVQAGGEILRMYLTKFVLTKGSVPLAEEDIARATYALYNSGPQNFKKFMARHHKREYLTSDKLFWDKYTWTRSGEFDRLKACLFGE